MSTGLRKIVPKGLTSPGGLGKVEVSPGDGAGGRSGSDEATWTAAGRVQARFVFLYGIFADGRGMDMDQFQLGTKIFMGGGLDGLLA